MNVRLEWFNRIVALLLIALICSCSMSMSGPESLSERLLVARSARLMELYLDEVSRALTDEELPGFREAYERGFSAEDVARRTLEEENGRKYLEFTLYSDDYQDVDEVLSAASALVPEEELSTIKSNIKELEERLYEGAEEESRVMTAAQKKAFYSELRKLVVKAAVLLTAAIVYACVPNLMFWGKVSDVDIGVCEDGHIQRDIRGMGEGDYERACCSMGPCQRSDCYEHSLGAFSCDSCYHNSGLCHLWHHR